jgi:hypothetical protein
MSTETMTPGQRQTRMNIRNFLLIATPAQLAQELEIAINQGDTFRANCIKELISES